MRLNGYKSKKLQECFLYYRGALRCILAKYLFIDPQEVSFGYTKYGKPFLNNGHLKLQFNLSHSYSLAVCAVCLGSKIGVDVEKIIPCHNLDELALEICSLQERQLFSSLPYAQKLEAFYSLWTGKESFTKADGRGLSIPLHEVELASLEALHVPTYLPRENASRNWSTSRVFLQGELSDFLCAYTVQRDFGRTVTKMPFIF